MIRKVILTIVIIGYATLGGVAMTFTQDTVETDKPLNIIFLIGDGMGVQQLSLTYFYGPQPPVFAEFQHIGLMNTSSATHKITDSGAGNSVFATGERTYNGAISMNTDSMPLAAITEIVSGMQYRTGVLATSSITHATPAAFYAHVPHRDMEFEIARQLVYADIDFFAAGGIDFFLDRPDQKDLFDSLRDRSFEIDTLSLDAFTDFDPANRYGYLLADEYLPVAANRGDFLPKATTRALEYFDQAGDPFFLMVEGSQIDWAGHDNDTQYMIDEVLDFQACVKIALDYAKKDGNTLVVVTADHETGGFALSTDYQNNKDYNKLTPSFATGGHTASLVPVFAYGPGADLFNGVYLNSAIFSKMMKLLNAE
ncbi:MAG: alkaline phosphatase [Bacteroidota bacterium]